MRGAGTIRDLMKVQTQFKEAKRTVHRWQDLVRLFDLTFADAQRTRLIKGADEPVYIPASNHDEYHQIIFAHGYYASALHEIAHWCLAGQARRLQQDYGYWYCPDGRNAEQQAAFEKVEIKPQAIEWGFCLAADKTFEVSSDNLNGVQADRFAFQAKVRAQLLNYLHSSFPPRAQRFIAVLRDFYQTPPLSEHVMELTNESTI